MRGRIAPGRAIRRRGRARRCSPGNGNSTSKPRRSQLPFELEPRRQESARSAAAAAAPRQRRPGFSKDFHEHKLAHLHQWQLAQCMMHVSRGGPVPVSESIRDREEVRAQLVQWPESNCGGNSGGPSVGLGANWNSRDSCEMKM